MNCCRPSRRSRKRWRTPRPSCSRKSRWESSRPTDRERVGYAASAATTAIVFHTRPGMPPRSTAAIMSSKTVSSFRGINTFILSRSSPLPAWTATSSNSGRVRRIRFRSARSWRVSFGIPRTGFGSGCRISAPGTGRKTTVKPSPSPFCWRENPAGRCGSV